MKKELLRFCSLFLGLFLYALGIVVTMKANIGFAPWEVFHAGLSKVFGISIGNISIIVGVCIGILAVLLGEKIGIATLLNMVLIGIWIDILLAIGSFPTITKWYIGFPVLILGLFTIALGSFFYIRSAYGAGPRDSLMVAIRRKTGLPIGLCRGGIELLAVIAGWFMGGFFGVGTVAAAIAIGFCIQITFSLLHFDPAATVHEDFGKSFTRAINLIRKKRTVETWK